LVVVKIINMEIELYCKRLKSLVQIINIYKFSDAQYGRPRGRRIWWRRPTVAIYLLETSRPRSPIHSPSIQHRPPHQATAHLDFQKQYFSPRERHQHSRNADELDLEPLPPAIFCFVPMPELLILGQNASHKHLKHQAQGSRGDTTKGCHTLASIRIRQQAITHCFCFIVYLGT
jgi:hypothetical protein